MILLKQPFKETILVMIIQKLHISTANLLLFYIIIRGHFADFLSHNIVSYIRLNFAIRTYLVYRIFGNVGEA